jgi:hypothetical protein
MTTNDIIQTLIDNKIVPDKKWGEALIKQGLVKPNGNDIEVLGCILKVGKRRWLKVPYD